jgi:hypothetical protein
MTHILGHYADAGGNEFFPRNYLTAADMDTQVAAWQKAGVSTADMNRRLLGATVAGATVGEGFSQGGSTGLPSFLDPKTILGEAPKTTFFSFQNQFGGAPTQRRHFQGQFQDIYNQYLGTLGQDIRQGQAPTRTFLDFMGNFNFSEQFGQIPPSIRGGTTGRFAPPARFLNF